MQQGITPAEILTADSAPKSAQKDKTYVAIREYPIYTYLHVRSLAFAFEVLKAIGMRRKRVVSAAAAAGSGLSRAPTAQDFYFSKQPSFLASCSSQTGSTHPKTIRGDERRQKENNQISGVWANWFALGSASWAPPIHVDDSFRPFLGGLMMR